MVSRSSSQHGRLPSCSRSSRCCSARSRCPAAPDSIRRRSRLVRQNLKSQPAQALSSRAKHIVPLYHPLYHHPLTHSLLPLYSADSRSLPCYYCLLPLLLDCIATNIQSHPPGARLSLTAATHLPTLSTTSPLPGVRTTLRSRHSPPPLHHSATTHHTLPLYTACIVLQHT